jgi:hypothetical protein
VPIPKVLENKSPIFCKMGFLFWPKPQKMICLRLFCALFALLRIAIPAIEISEWGGIFLKKN